MAITSSTLHPRPYLETQSEMLSNRASRYLALSATEHLMSHPEYRLAKEKKRELLSSKNFYRDLEALFQKHSTSYLEKAAFHMLVIPFCQKLAPPLFRRTTDKITTAALSICKQGAPFPSQVMSQKLHHLSSYFSVLHSALQRAAHTKMMTGDLEKQITEELEKAQSLHHSSPQLYAKSIERAIHSVTCSLEETLLGELQERHALIRYPGQLAITSTFFFLKLGLVPWVSLGKLCLSQKLKNVAGKNVSSIQLSPELASPLISFADHLLLALFKNIQHYKDHSTIPPIDMDKEVLRKCIKQQIVLLSLCSSFSETQLRSAMEDSRWKQLVDQILDNYVLDGLVKSIVEQLSIAWQTVTEEGLIEEELYQLFLALNEELIYGETSKADLDQLNKTVDTISLYLTKESVHTTLSGIEQRLDKSLDPLCRWKEVKPFVIKTLSSWTGLEEPIKIALAARLIPLVTDISNRAFDYIVDFWKIPYNLRYGLLHYQLLLPRFI